MGDGEVVVVAVEDGRTDETEAEVGAIDVIGFIDADVDAIG